MVDRVAINRRLFLATGTAAGLTVAGCSPWENYGFNYSLSIRALVGGRLVEGRSVIHTGWHWQFLAGLDDLPKYVARTTGDAVTLELGEGKKLFGLITPPFDMSGFRAQRVDEVLQPYADGQSGDEVPYGSMARLQGEYPVPQDHWPVVVRFRDVRKPDTIEILDPLRLPDDYGPSSRITSVSLKVTDDPVTFHIDQDLPWLASMKGDMAGSVGTTGRWNDATKTTYTNFKLRGETR
jgi:hypothetical protein